MPAPQPRPAVRPAVPRALDADRHPVEPATVPEAAVEPPAGAVDKTAAGPRRPPARRRPQIPQPPAPAAAVVPLVSLSTRIPQDLRRRLRVHCLGLDVEVQDWLTAAITERLDREQTT